LPRVDETLALFGFNPFQI